METVKAKDLKFKRIPLAEAKQFFCNFCATAGFTFNWFQATVPFAKDGVFKIVVCSEKCLHAFKDDPGGKSQSLIDDSIKEMKNVHAAKKRIKHSDGVNN